MYLSLYQMRPRILSSYGSHWVHERILSEAVSMSMLDLTSQGAQPRAQIESSISPGCLLCWIGIQGTDDILGGTDAVLIAGAG
jgi:hypothetical protein